MGTGDLPEEEGVSEWEVKIAATDRGELGRAKKQPCVTAASAMPLTIVRMTRRQVRHVTQGCPFLSMRFSSLFPSFVPRTEAEGDIIAVRRGFHFTVIPGRATQDHLQSLSQRSYHWWHASHIPRLSV